MRLSHASLIIFFIWFFAIIVLFFALPSAVRNKEARALQEQGLFYVSKPEHETVPRVCSIAIAIISHASAVQERDAVRQTWLSSLKLYGYIKAEMRMIIIY